MSKERRAAMRVVISVVAVFLSLVVSRAQADTESEFLSGNQWLPACRAALAFVDKSSADKSSNGITTPALMCMEYVHGFLDGFENSLVQRFWAAHPQLENSQEIVPSKIAAFAKANEPWCKPSGVTNAQVTRIAVQFMERNPNLLHFPFSNLLGMALKENFPCQRGK